jgi:hypothetical protein
MSYNYSESGSLSYQQQVLKQIDKIQNISAKELRDSSKVVKNLIGEQTLEAEDTRYSYLQAVETLGSMLSPYFNTNVGQDFDNFCSLFDMELVEALNDKDYIKELGEFFNIQGDISTKINNDNKLQNQANVYFLNDKIKCARRMFRSLVKLFKDNDFLAGESYGEGSSEGSDNGMEAFGDDEGDIGE